jgi:hypothetical protein
MRMNGNMPMTMGTLAKITIVGEYAVLKISELLQKLNLKATLYSMQPFQG